MMFRGGFICYQVVHISSSTIAKELNTEVGRMGLGSWGWSGEWQSVSFANGLMTPY